jgi:hypothetical protein
MHKLFYGKNEVQVQVGNIAFDSASVQTYMIEDVYNSLNDMVYVHMLYIKLSLHYLYYLTFILLKYHLNVHFESALEI